MGTLQFPPDFLSCCHPVSLVCTRQSAGLPNLLSCVPCLQVLEHWSTLAEVRVNLPMTFSRTYVILMQRQGLEAKLVNEMRPRIRVSFD